MKDTHIFFVNGDIVQRNIRAIQRHIDLIVTQITHEIKADEVVIMTTNSQHYTGCMPIRDLTQEYKERLDTIKITEQIYDHNLLQNLLEKDSGTIIVLLVKEEKSIPNKYLKELNVDTEEDNLLKNIPEAGALYLSFTPKPNMVRMVW